MNRHGLVSCSPACSAMSAAGWLFAGSTAIASNRSADAAARTRPWRRHGPHAVLRARHPWQGGVDERLALEEIQMTPYTLPHVIHRARASPHPASGQWKRKPGLYPIVMRGSRPPTSASRNSTSVTRQGSTSCRAAADGIVVSMPPKLPDRRHRLTRFTHTKQ